ncbi:MAG: sensor domain-containing diguanylate cyclase [Spirochaetae bacterium HGW-Spirochaetae-5]|nr:MAG: sensor domain-containing diguanylate cyclase [Spirochaetae bacterium HGW-Spirochaetae-5]
MTTIHNKHINSLDKDNLEKMVFDLQNLLEIALSLSSNLEFDSLVESILYICIGQMIVDKAAIFLNSNLENDELTLYMSRGYTLEPDLKIVSKSKLINYLYSNCGIIDSDKARELMSADPTTKETYDMLKPEIVIPLKSKNSINGLIFLSQKIMENSYTEHDFQFLEKMAKFASIAVENSRLYRMATLDRMTGLFIHHYFQERLVEEIKRSERTGTPLTLIMADLDHFKDVNDTYGHQQGDIILKGTASIIHQNIRAFDIASRYGGEEFAIILTETDIEAAYTIAERLRKKIEAEVYENGNKELTVTISIGLAQFNHEIDKNGIDLIKRADTALYSAKATGRNRVIKSD